MKKGAILRDRPRLLARPTLIAGFVLFVLALLIVGLILVTTPPVEGQASSDSLATAKAPNLSKWTILYVNRGNLFALPLATASTATPILTDPLYSNFGEWDWSSQAHAFVGKGDDGLYIVKLPNDPVPRLLLSTDNAGYSYLTYPSWSSDGKKIAFIAVGSDNNGQPISALMVYDLASATLTTLFGPVSQDQDVFTKEKPAWSADDKEIAVSYRTQGGFALPTVALISSQCPGCLTPLQISSTLYTPAPTVPGGDTNQPGSGDFLDNPAWSPVGQRLAVSCKGGLCIVNYSNEAATAFKRLIVEVDCGFHFVWSPDGRYIACPSSGMNGFQVIDTLQNSAPFSIPVSDYYDVRPIAWVNTANVVVTENIPPLPPTPTAPIPLIIKAQCQISSIAWEWIVINNNPQDVPVVVKVLDAGTQQPIQEEDDDIAPKAKNGAPGVLRVNARIPGTVNFTPPAPGSHSAVAQLYVGGVLVSSAPSLTQRCPTNTPNPTETPQ